VHPIVDLQIEYSLVSRRPEQAILPTCAELGIAVTAYGVLSRGMLARRWAGDSEPGPGDIRRRMPRFRAENLRRNAALVDALAGVAEQRGLSAAQAAIAWVLARGSALGVGVVPLIGTRQRDRLVEAIGAARATLTEEDLAAIERAVPADAVAGDRYDAAQMAALDSER
jgi:aryl-alcohol dehydrogenase-like predicted oxidoreductase